MKRISVILLSMLLILSLFGGCAGKTTSTPQETASQTPAEASDQAANSPAGEKTYKIGISVNNLTNPFRVAEFDQIFDWFEAHPNCELVYTAAGNDVTQQIADMEDLIAQQCDIIMINCINEEAMTPTLQLAKEKGIPVVAWDRAIRNTDLRLACGMLDNYNDFKEYANRVVKAFEGQEEAKIYLLMSQPGNPVTIDREGGLRDGIAESGATNINIIGVDYCNNSRAEAIEILESVILANPDLAAICCEIDETALGAIQVLKANDMMDKVLVFGNDGQKEGLEAIMNGELQFTIKAPIDPFLGVLMLDVVLDYLEDGKFDTELEENNIFYCKTYYVDSSNVQDYYDPDSAF